VARSNGFDDPSFEYLYFNPNFSKTDFEYIVEVIASNNKISLKLFILVFKNFYSINYYRYKVYL
jgi:hypothetical protein